MKFYFVFLDSGNYDFRFDFTPSGGPFFYGPGWSVFMRGLFFSKEIELGTLH
ncbi:MAG: hypothetical protein ACTSWL_05650 [Promethearchaeota archaeon]